MIRGSVSWWSAPEADPTKQLAAAILRQAIKDCERGQEIWRQEAQSFLREGAGGLIDALDIDPDRFARWVQE